MSISKKTEGLAATVDPEWAWAEYVPGGDRPWEAPLAAHLLRRAGFGPAREEIDRAVREGPKTTVDRLLEPEVDAASFEALYSDYERSAAGSIDSLRAWWLRRMIDTPHPLLEKMTLFWHGHFATSHGEVGSGPLMQRHVAVLRENALGGFTTLLKAAALDPALLKGLAADAARKATPPAALARALLSHFTVGPGNYTDQDASETARAFTGWFVFRTRREFIARERDEGEKTIFGRSGDFTAEEALEILAARPATARRIVGKLYRLFISEEKEPPAELLDPLVESFGAEGRIAAVVETMLRSNLFFSAAAYRGRVKSPVELGVGLVRAMEGAVATDRLGRHLAQLGQDLYSPPTAAGWPDGVGWLNDATIAGRNRLAWTLLRPGGDQKFRLDAAALAAARGYKDPPRAARFLLELLLQGDVDPAAAKTLFERADQATPGQTPAAIAQAACLIACLPEYQLA